MCPPCVLVPAPVPALAPALWLWLCLDLCLCLCLCLRLCQYACPFDCVCACAWTCFCACGSLCLCLCLYLWLCLACLSLCLCLCQFLWLGLRTCASREKLKPGLREVTGKKNQLTVFCYPGLEFDSLHKLLWNKTKPCINSVKVRKRSHTQETPPKLQKRIVYNL